MEKLPGVESAAVKLNEGKAVLQLQPGNTLTLAQIREGVRRNGFTPRDAVVTANAEAVLAGDTLRLRISGTQEVYDVSATEALEKLLRAAAHQSVVVEGKIPFEKDPNAGVVLQVTSVKPVTR